MHLNYGFKIWCSYFLFYDGLIYISWILVLYRYLASFLNKKAALPRCLQLFPLSTLSRLLKIWDKEKVGDGKSRLSKEITYSSERIRIRSNKFSFVWTNNIFVQTNNYSSFVYRSKHILIPYRKRRLCRSFFHQYLILHSCLLVCLRFAHIWKSCLEKKLWNLRENTQTEKNELNLSKKTKQFT